MGIQGGATAFVAVFGYFLASTPVTWNTGNITWGYFAFALVAGLSGSAGLKAILDNVQWKKVVVPAALERDPATLHGKILPLANSPAAAMKLL